MQITNSVQKVNMANSFFGTVICHSTHKVCINTQSKFHIGIETGTFDTSSSHRELYEGAGQSKTDRGQDDITEWPVTILSYQIRY